MVTCPSSRRENPDDSRFCNACGAALAGADSGGGEERKTVTIVFVDLVGFTAQAERLDPEDVRSVLSRYHTRVRAELEHHGGTVEKFIGDAVMAVFGARGAASHARRSARDRQIATCLRAVPCGRRAKRANQVAPGPLHPLRRAPVRGEIGRAHV